MNKKLAGSIALGLAAAGTLLAADELRDLNLPEQIPGLIDWFLASKSVSIVKYAAVVTMVVQLIKTAAVLFGAKLPSKFTPGVVALIGLLGLWETSTADGVINGGDWSALVVALLGTVGAFFGYKVLFSKNAAVQE